MSTNEQSVRVDSEGYCGDLAHSMRRFVIVETGSGCLFEHNHLFVALRSRNASELLKNNDLWSTMRNMVAARMRLGNSSFFSN